MLREVLLLALLGVCCGSFFDKSLKFANSVRNGVHRFSIKQPTQEMESASDKLGANPDLLTKLQKLKDALLLRGQPLTAFQGPLAMPHKASSPAGGKVQGYHIQSCSAKPELDTFVIHQLLVQPDPLEMPGNLKFIFNISITQQLDNIQAALDLSKRVGNTYIKIPCVGQFGSCTYDVCQLLQTVETCPEQLEDIKFDCTCPFHKRSYVSQGMEFVVEAAIFPPGDYMIVADLTTPSGANSVQAGCYNITLSIA